MKILHITVKDKIATYFQRDGVIVCGNKGYKIAFNFDEEWAEHPIKTARFVWNEKYYDQEFSGDECPVPVISDATEVEVGVYAGDLKTTTPAEIPCLISILCGTSEATEGKVKEYRDEAKQAADRVEEALKNGTGVSPTVAVTEIEDGHRVTITDINGTQSFDVMDGAGGECGSITSGGTGAAYTANVPWIKELVAGVRFTMIAHRTSISQMPTLDVNGLGAKGIYRKVVDGLTSSILPTTSFIRSDRPYTVMFDGSHWLLLDFPRAAANDLYGVVPVDKGGVPTATAKNSGQVLTVGNDGKPTWQDPSSSGGSGDLSAYQTKNDESLETESKEVVGAINELNAKISADNSIIGKWMFNETITNFGYGVKVEIRFSSYCPYNYGNEYTSMEFGAPGSNHTLLYGRSGPCPTIYDFNTKTWNYSQSRLVEFFSGTTNADFVAWLRANATKIEADDSSSSGMPLLYTVLTTDSTLESLYGFLRYHNVSEDEYCLIVCKAEDGSKRFDDVIVKISEPFAGGNYVNLIWVTIKSGYPYSTSFATQSSIGDFLNYYQNALTTTEKTVSGAINELNAKTDGTDKVKFIDTWYGNRDAVSNDGDGISWENRFVFDGDNGVITEGAISQQIPLVAGKNVTFSYDEENKAIAINATGGSGGTNDLEMPIIQFCNFYDDKGTMSLADQNALHFSFKIVGGGALQDGDKIQLCLRRTYWYKYSDEKQQIFGATHYKKQKLRMLIEHTLTAEEIENKACILTISEDNGAMRLSHNDRRGGTSLTLSPMYFRLKRVTRYGSDGKENNAIFSNVITVWKTYGLEENKLSIK